MSSSVLLPSGRWLACSLLLACAFIVKTPSQASSLPETTPLRNLVGKFTKERAGPPAPAPTPQPSAPVPAQPVIQRAVEPAATAVSAVPLPQATAKPAGGRKPSPPLTSLPAPKASGPLKILLVDDDESSNNVGGNTGAVQSSDEVFRALVAAAVGGKADAWAADVVKSRANGPGIERLRGFNVVIWYTGASYGSGNDTLGREDEKTLRRYLEEVGGSVILISPGYVNNLVYGQSWTAAEHPFLKEVLAVNGCYGLAQRGAPGTVKAHDGAQYAVEHPGAAGGAVFSVVNPDGAAIVFTSPLRTSYVNQEGELPVAVANAYGQGRAVYASFPLENIPEKERTKAFATLLEAAVGKGRATGPAPSAGAGETRQEFSVLGNDTTLFTFTASQPGPIRLQVQARGKPITVTVHHPDGRKQEHTGAGAFSVQNQVTAQDLAQGHVWGVSVRAAEKTADAHPVATGTIAVTHPPGDPVAVQRQTDQYAPRTASIRQRPVVKIESPTAAALRQISQAPTAAPATMERTPVARTATPPIQQITSVVEPTPTAVVGTAAGIVPGVVSTVQFAGPEPIVRFGAPKGSAGATLKIWGKDLCPPGTGAGRVMEQPASFPAEMRIVWNQREFVVPLKAWETFSGWKNPSTNETEDDETRYQKYIDGQYYVGALRHVYFRGYEAVLPDIGVLDDSFASVTIKTTDGRRSKAYDFKFEPIRTTATIRLPIVNGRLVDSKLAASYPNADISKGTIRRDSLVAGYEGEDEFYLTTQLKNGWKVTRIDIAVDEHYGGARIVESHLGTATLYTKVKWEIIFVFPPLTDLDYVTYDLHFHLSGPVGQPFL
ncbi:MAG: hypothetical protein JNL92_13355 [Opitutaceae bacterium]|nr:hypothetical protein [Opitutaceae bacterium]